MMRHILSCAAALCLGLSAMAQASECTNGNALADPGFELQTPPRDYIYYLGGWFVPRSEFAQFGHSGAYSVAGPALQQVPAAPGQKWRLTGYGYAPSAGAHQYAFIQVGFADANGAPLAPVEATNNASPVRTSTSIDRYTSEKFWYFLDTGIATAPAPTVTAPARTAFVQVWANCYFEGTPYMCTQVYFDDLNLQLLGMSHSIYVSSIKKNTNALVSAGTINATQQSEIVTAASKSCAGAGQNSQY